jgi:hypothetical protein
MARATREGKGRRRGRKEEEEEWGRARRPDNIDRSGGARAYV